jgi:acyl transferase domain-containing protein
MEPLAVVGFSFKLPQGIEDESHLWEVLSNGRNLMTEWPDSRANIDAFYDAGRQAGKVGYNCLSRFHV